jgi:hypothetical protein
VLCVGVWLGFSGLAAGQAAPASHAAIQPAEQNRPDRAEMLETSAMSIPGPASAQISPSATAAPLDLLESFDAISDTGWYPPDPIIAAGPASVVAMVNSQIAIFDKQGNQLFQQRLDGNGGFWKAQKPSFMVGDPWVIYDPHAGRFIAIAADFGITKIGFLYLAISTPVGSADWHKYALDLTGTHQNPDYAGEPTFPDYPKAAVDDQALYITANHFGINSGQFSHNQIIAIDKAPLLSGGPVNLVYEQSFTTLFGPLHPVMVFDPGSPMYCDPGSQRGHGFDLCFG